MPKVALGIRQVSFRYQKEASLILDKINLWLQEGEVLSILGPSGTGKSTLQKLILGLLQGFEGEISIFCKPLQEWGRSIYNNIGVCFELPSHYLKLTGLENLELFSSLYQTKCFEPEALLERLLLKDAKDVRVEHYSKGMKMRLNMARALLNQPKLLCLDEPTSGLDPIHVDVIQSIIHEEKNKGTAVLITSHDMNFVDNVSDQVAFLSKGRIIKMGRPIELKRRYSPDQLHVTYFDNGQVIQKTFSLSALSMSEQFIKIVKHHTIINMHTQQKTLADLFIDIE